MTTIASEIERLQTAKADIKASLEAKGVTVDSAATLDVYDDYVDEIPEGSSGYKDVIFIDYDGTVLYQYTAEEFLALTAMPANPTGRTGFVAQGWNWSLADAQDYVERYGSHCIGQMYDTVDSSTLINIDITEYVKTIGLIFGVYSGSASDVKIDWGDGTEETTTNTHTYAIAGNYTIKIKSYNNAKIYWNSQSYSSSKLVYNAGVTGNLVDKSMVTISMLRYVFFGGNVVSIGQYALPNVSNSPVVSEFGYGIQTIGLQNPIRGSVLILPSSLTNISGGSVYGCRFMSLPNSLTTMRLNFGVSFDNEVYAIYIPRSCTTIQQYSSFCGVYRAIIPETVTTLSEFEDGANDNVSILQYLYVAGKRTSFPGNFLGKNHLNDLELHIDLSETTSLGGNAFGGIYYNAEVFSGLDLSKISALSECAAPINTPCTSLKSDVVLGTRSLGDLYYPTKVLSIPAGATVNNSYVLMGRSRNTAILDKLILNSASNLYANAFSSANIQEIIFNFDVTSLPDNLFSNTVNILKIDFTQCTTIPTLGSGALPGVNSLFNETQILVPAALYEDWIAASGWSSYASRIVPVGDVPYEPTQEETEDINAILGEDSSDPIIPDITEEEAEEILDDIIGGE